MWGWQRFAVFRRYGYYRRFRPWYGYPFRGFCFVGRRRFFFFFPWKLILYPLGFLIFLCIIF